MVVAALVEVCTLSAWTTSSIYTQNSACETVRENCNCDNDDDVCEAKWNNNDGMSNCIQEIGDDFEIQRYLECHSKLICLG